MATAPQHPVEQAVSELLDAPREEPVVAPVVIRPPGLNFAQWLKRPLVLVGAFAGSLLMCYFGLRWLFSSSGSTSTASSISAATGATKYAAMQQQALELARLAMSGQNELDQVIGQAAKGLRASAV